MKWILPAQPDMELAMQGGLYPMGGHEGILCEKPLSKWSNKELHSLLVKEDFK